MASISAAWRIILVLMRILLTITASILDKGGAFGRKGFMKVFKG
jgi:hypothetical protein